MKNLAAGALLALLALPAAGLDPYLVKDINPVPSAAGSSPSYPVALGGAVLFIADGGDGQDLWRSDGTELGTSPAVDFGPEDDIFQPLLMVSLGDRLVVSVYGKGLRPDAP
jgi:ELWxxDGT repeat protein